MESLTVKAQNLIFVCRCLYLSLFVFICLYLSIFVFICLYLSGFVLFCLDLFLKGSILIKYMLF